MALNFQALNKNYFHMILFDMLQELVSIFHSVDMATLFLNLNLKFARCKHLHKVTCTAYNAPWLSIVKKNLVAQFFFDEYGL